MAKLIKMSGQKAGEFDEDIFLSALECAGSVEILKFLGEVMRVHKIHELPHTQDEQFMQRCRAAYSNRQQALLKEKKNGRRVRQQHVGDHQPERSKVDGNASRLQGDMRNRQQGVLDLGMGQGA